MAAPARTRTQPIAGASDRNRSVRTRPGPRALARGCPRTPTPRASTDRSRGSFGPLRPGVPGVLEESGKAVRQGLGQGRLAGLAEDATEQQRPGIVVGAVAVRAVWNGMKRVLQQSGLIAEGQQMLESQRWRSLGVRIKPARVRPRRLQTSMASTSLLEDVAVTLGHSRPYHRPTLGIGALAHGESPRRIAEQCRGLAADGRGVAKRHQDAAPVIQQFARVP